MALSSEIPGAAPAVRMAPMRMEDLEAVSAIEAHSHSSPWPRELFAQELDRPFSRIILALAAAHSSSESRVLGYVCFWKIADEIQILNIAVHPGHRRQGIGRALLLHALQRGYRRHGRRALLEVRAGNKAARRLYESTGFRVVGKRPRYYGPGPEGTALVMELKLTSGRRFSEAKGRKVRR